MTSFNTSPFGNNLQEGVPATPDNTNPDRVRFEERNSEETVIIKNSPELIPFHYREQGPLSFHLGTKNIGELSRYARAVTLVGAGLLTVASNLGTEVASGGSNEKLTNANEIQKGLESQTIETFARNVQNDVCRYIDGDFMERFTTKDDEGNESFNPGAFVVPFAVSLTEQCKARVDVEIHIPYDFARTFREVVAKNPQARNELVTKLANFIRKEAENQIVIRGIAGLTDTAMVWNKANNTLIAGKPKISLGDFSISNLNLEGVASAEAEASKLNTGESSLKGFNPENVKLAEKRLNEFSPILKEALGQIGIDPQVLANAKTFSYEHNLIDSEISSLARIGEQVFGKIVKGGDDTLAYMLVNEYNNNNPLALKAIKQIPGAEETLKKLLDDARGVNISFTADTEYKKEEVFNLAIPFPALLLILGALRISTSRGKERVVEGVREIPIPDTIIKTNRKTFEPVARRLFSEATPTSLDEKRDFNELYDNLDTTSRPQDSHTLLIHMLTEEVLPSLLAGKQEPIINYEYILNKYRDFLRSDTRRDGITKGSYDTSEEAQRRITEELLETWERHDAQTYPMEGIDIKTVLNYRHSEHVIYWAKTLAECFLRLMKETNTTEEIRNALVSEIQKAIQVRGDTVPHNAFVKTQLPL